MGKLKSFADNYVFNRLVFKILMVVAVMITAVPYLHTEFGKYVKLLLVYGILIIGYEFVTGKLFKVLKQKVNWLLIGFCVSYGITLIINRDNAFVEGIKSFAYVIVFFVLFFMFTGEHSKEKVVKEMQIISGVIVVCTFALSLASIITYAFSISGHYANNDGIFVYYGLYENRLWGVYNPNTGSTLNCISMLLSIGFILAIKKRWVIVLNAINIFLQFSCLILTGSRAAYYIMLVLLIALTVFITFKKFNSINFRSICIAVVCVAVISVAFVGTGNLLKEGYSYVPSIVKTIIYELENAHSDGTVDEEDKPTIDKQDFTRLEEVENREGGFFNGRAEMWVACLKSFKESPLFGVGNENLISNSLKYFEDDTWKEHFRTGGSHNIYVCLLTSAGIIGFLLVGIFAAITLIKSGLTFLKKYNKASTWLLISIGMCVMFYVTEFVEARILFQVSTFSVIFWLFNGYMYRLAELEKGNIE